jgi:hypothetical protein
VGNFGCYCGFRLESPSSGFDNQGEYIDTADYIDWREGLAKALADFLRASLEGNREAWLRECGYLPPDYPVDEPDEEIFDTLLELSLRPKCLGVYRCPQCSRIYLQMGHGANEWGGYRLEGEVGDRYTRYPWLPAEPDPPEPK